jgi:hypothetical protein
LACAYCWGVSASPILAGSFLRGTRATERCMFSRCYRGGLSPLATSRVLHETLQPAAAESGALKRQTRVPTHGNHTGASITRATMPQLLGFCRLVIPHA